jgi:GNAT superfamily N-acetyltransferase
MTLSVEIMTARARPDDQIEQLFGDGWPAFITADHVVTQHIGKVRRLFADLEIVLLDEGDVPVAAGWAVPLRWDGDPAHLPGGYTDSLVRAVDGHDGSERPDTLVVMAAQVHPGRRGQGLAGELLSAMRHLAAQRGWARVIAPVRPTLKSRYPLTSIDRFASWTRDDGLSLDPWLRTHQRLGARVIATAPASQTMTGTVRQWEEWAGMRFPDSGTYVIPGGLSTLQIDLGDDRGIYIEPNVWMEHHL